MRLRSLDLNLLLTLDALLSERGVTAAAHRMGTSQPTMSTGLARLRRHFGDALLERVGNHYELTPLAASLRPQVVQAVTGVERVFASQSSFDPGTSERQFSVMSSDYGATVVGPVLHRLLAEASPGSHLHLLALTRDGLERPDEVLPRVDALLMPRGVLQGLPHLDLLSDEWVAVVDRRNERVAGQLSTADLAAVPWVLTAGDQSGTAGSVGTIPVVRQMQLLGVRLAVTAVVESFTLALLLVEGTDRVTVAPRRLVEQVAGHRSLRVVDLPFDAVPLVEAAWWHPVHQRDGGHQWLRQRLAEASTHLTGAGHRPPR